MLTREGPTFQVDWIGLLSEVSQSGSAVGGGAG